MRKAGLNRIEIKNVRGQRNMVDKTIQEFSKIVDAFAEMRNGMRNSQKYSAKMAATNDLYEAIRRFAPNIGLLPPFIPIEPDNGY
jgi:hypothetical protein